MSGALAGVAAVQAELVPFLDGQGGVVLGIVGTLWLGLKGFEAWSRHSKPPPPPSGTDDAAIAKALSELSAATLGMETRLGGSINSLATEVRDLTGAVTNLRVELAQSGRLPVK